MALKIKVLLGKDLELFCKEISWVQTRYYKINDLPPPCPVSGRLSQLLKHFTGCGDVPVTLNLVVQFLKKFLKQNYHKIHS